MDILLTHLLTNILILDEKLLNELNNFLNFEDETILNYYHYDLIESDIDKNDL